MAVGIETIVEAVRMEQVNILAQFSRFLCFMYTLHPQGLLHSDGRTDFDDML